MTRDVIVDEFTTLRSDTWAKLRHLSGSPDFIRNYTAQDDECEVSRVSIGGVDVIRVTLRNTTTEPAVTTELMLSPLIAEQICLYGVKK